MFNLLLTVALSANAAADSYPTKPTYHLLKIKKGDSFSKLFGKNWTLVARFNRLDEKHLVIGKKIKVPDNLEVIKEWSPLPKEYALAMPHKKYILVSLEDQFLGVYQNGKLIFDMPISSGRPLEKCDSPTGDCSTPTRIFQTLGGDWNHTSSVYDDPTGNPYPMPWAVRFHINKNGVQYWIHGGDLPGYPASHGCVRVTKKDALKLFRWLFPKAPKKEFWIKKDKRTLVEIK